MLLYKIKYDKYDPRKCAEVCPVHPELQITKTMTSNQAHIGSNACMGCPHNLDKQGVVERGFVWCEFYEKLMYKQGQQIELPINN